MLLIFTNSIDTTTDLLLDRMPEIPVFRFNINLWRDYSWEINPDGFSIKDPLGRQCDSGTAVLAYQRKPIFLNSIDVPAGGCLENWCREEVTAIWKNIYFDFSARGRACLVYPGNGKWGKIRQLWLAKRYFPVPTWLAARGEPDSRPTGATIAKAVTQTRLETGKVFMTKEVDVDRLDPGYPWFIQSRIDAQADVTVVYVNGDMFAFELDRGSFSGIDYRIHFDKDLEWHPCSLDPSEEAAIQGFMAQTGYGFGRLDFLRRDGQLLFLELNPNGQWAWLDPDGHHGLLDRIVHELKEHYCRCSAGVESGIQTIS